MGSLASPGNALFLVAAAVDDLLARTCRVDAVSIDHSADSRGEIAAGSRGFFLSGISALPRGVLRVLAVHAAGGGADERFCRACHGRRWSRRDRRLATADRHDEDGCPELRRIYRDEDRAGDRIGHYFLDR